MWYKQNNGFFSTENAIEWIWKYRSFKYAPIKIEKLNKRPGRLLEDLRYYIFASIFRVTYGIRGSKAAYCVSPISPWNSLYARIFFIPLRLPKHLRIHRFNDTVVASDSCESVWTQLWKWIWQLLVRAWNFSDSHISAQSNLIKKHQRQAFRN